MHLSATSLSKLINAACCHLFSPATHSSTVCIASAICPWGSSIRHAKVKTAYCHLEWLNVYQTPRCTSSPYGIWIWHPLRESIPFFVSVCLLLKSYSTTLLSLVTLKVHVEWTHTRRGGRMSSFITCSGCKASQRLGKFRVSACLANTSWKSLGDRPLTKPDRRLTGKMSKAYRCKDTRSHCGSVLCVSTRWIWISALLSVCLSTLFSVLLNWTGPIVCQRHKVWFRVKPSYV